MNIAVIIAIVILLFLILEFKYNLPFRFKNSNITESQTKSQSNSKEIKLSENQTAIVDGLEIKLIEAYYVPGPASEREVVGERSCPAVRIEVKTGSFSNSYELTTRDDSERWIKVGSYNIKLEDIKYNSKLKRLEDVVLKVSSF
ncbi:MAG: hypothetical protein NT078_02340 [Candidatus Azambacteria bacterium]|nr:hypothetical protein [Candidatus Azambacteria bacterium]